MTTTVVGVRFEHRRAGDALGIGVAAPRVSWITETEVSDWRQTAYEIEVRDDDGAVVATSGQVESDESVLVPWPAPRLTSRQRRLVAVRVWGSDGVVSGWSEPELVEAGLLEPADWTARFVSPHLAPDHSLGTAPASGSDPVEGTGGGATGEAAASGGQASRGDEPPTTPPSLVRREFQVDGEVVRARLYVTALGVYEVEVNGRTVGDQVLAPGWTSYDHRLRVETLDVTGFLQAGANAVGVWLAEGWYGGRLGWEGGRRVYGHQLAVLAQLEAVLADGSTVTIVTAPDGSWESHAAPIVSSSIYDGETYDARREQPGWSSPGFDATGWGPVTEVERDLTTLVARTGPPVRRTEEVAPADVRRTPDGRVIVDFGQNLVGRVRITLEGQAGTTVTLRHAEILQDGELCTEPLRLAAATDRYTLRGGGEETWEPRFTFHGFRYAELGGWPGDAALPTGVLTAVVCHSDMERTGWFSCSDEQVTKLHDNVVWGMRGNFLDVPTDCPQRDERLGWTGDINVFAPTASFLYDSAGFLASWLADLAAEQYPDGQVPLVVPDVLGVTFPAAVWADAAVVVPWVLYQRFGDVGVLRDQHQSMRAWVDHAVGLAGDDRLWGEGFQFADWLDPAAPEDRPQEGRTDPPLVATAALCHSLDVLSRAADLVGDPAGAARYGGVAAEVRAAFAREYLAPSGLMVSDSPTAYALALTYGLLPEADQRARAGRRLAKLVRQAGYRIATGFVGTPLMCDALCRAGEAPTAYELLLQTECPSWLYAVVQGATTVWERWDGLRPDGSLNGTRMNSFNHYALGAVADWLHRTVAGLASAAPGYRQVRIAPVPGGGLTWASARHRTPYGMAEASWQVDGDELEVTAVIPPNTTGIVVLPGVGSEAGAVAGGGADPGPSPSSSTGTGARSSTRTGASSQAGDDDPLVVGSGRHVWRIPDPPNRVTRGAPPNALSLGT